MAIALLPPLDGDRASPQLRQAAARLVRAAGMRELAQAACERSRELLLDDHDRRLRMRAWMQEPITLPLPVPVPVPPSPAPSPARQP